MAVNMAENQTLYYALRVLQLISASIVMGTDGYAIHGFRGYNEYIESEFGNFYAWHDVPDAWGFLTFCAGWTILTVIFHPVAGIIFADRAFIGYVRVAVEAVAVLSWLAGFIAVAVEIGTETCSAGKNSACGTLIAATVFGAFEWLLFMATATLTARLVFNSFRKPRTSMTGPAAAVPQETATQKIDE